MEMMKKFLKKSVHYNKKMNNFHENVLIGSGPSGSITGYKLSKAGYDTLIIEKGNHYTIPKFKHPFSEFQKNEYTGISGAIGKYDFQ